MPRPTVLYIARSGRECTACPRPASLPGCHQSTTTPGMWQHDTRPICFTLVVDDFGVKYVNKADAEHLLNAIQKYYKCLSDWDAKQYCGLTFKWDYEGRKVHSSMPNCLAKALQRFQHPPPVKVQDKPYTHVKPNYGTREQFANPEDTSLPSIKLVKKLFRGFEAYSFSLHMVSMANYYPPSAHWPRSNPTQSSRG